MQVRSKKSETDMVGAIRAGLQRCHKSPHVFLEVARPC